MKGSAASSLAPSSCAWQAVSTSARTGACDSNNITIRPTPIWAACTAACVATAVPAAAHPSGPLSVLVQLT